MAFLAFLGILLVSFCISLGSPNATYPFHLLSPSEIANASLILWGSTYYGDDPLNAEHAALSDSLGANWESYELLHRRSFFLAACPAKYPTCYITTNPKYAPQTQVLLFHWNDLSVSPFAFPKSRPPNQLWTVLNLESPANLWPLNAAYPPFNLTATYQADSDIVVPYGKLVAGPSANSSDIHLESKIKSVTWFVSNCQTKGHREAFVAELSTYIDVHIYGKCGSLTCSASIDIYGKCGANANNCSHSVAQECYAIVAREAFFYLSFENSICRDYVTEKVFNILAYDIVPVVFGGANYSALLPPHSYIDATNMRPSELATLLRRLTTDSEEYLKYFAWRANWSVISVSDFSNLYCSLCRETETGPKERSPHSRTVKEINEWLFNEGTCWQSAFWKEKLAPRDAQTEAKTETKASDYETHFIDY